jgi:hypothetical protein
MEDVCFKELSFIDGFNGSWVMRPNAPNIKSQKTLSNKMKLNKNQSIIIVLIN